MAVIADLGFDSFENTENGFTAYIPEQHHKNINLDGFIFDDFKFSYRIEELKEQNWNSEWEKNFEPVVIDHLLCIRAPFHEQRPGMKYEIVIMPKMSFGTGHHQTTRLMCRQMAALDLSQKSLLDMGCGTGVLAIFSKMLGAAEVCAIDIDEWSVENAIENAQVNGFSDIGVISGGEEALKDLALFDVILANINKNVLKAQIPLYAQKLKPGGKLLLSGFFVTDAEELKSHLLQAKLEFSSLVNENEWAVISAQK